MGTKFSWIIIVSTVLIFFLIIFVAITLVNINPKTLKNGKKTATSNTQVAVPEKEKGKIDRWILKNNLNPYGDPYTSVYTGGTPLFNETTGEKMDRYEYIIGQHPDKPWNK